MRVVDKPNPTAVRRTTEYELYYRVCSYRVCTDVVYPTSRSPTMLPLTTHETRVDRKSDGSLGINIVLSKAPWGYESVMVHGISADALVKSGVLCAGDFITGTFCFCAPNKLSHCFHFFILHRSQRNIRIAHEFSAYMQPSVCSGSVCDHFTLSFQGPDRPSIQGPVYRPRVS